MSRAGYVLTGGGSSRMGQDKALLPFQGRTLAGYVARQVAQAAGTVVLVGSPQRYDFIGLPVIADVYPGAGPLGGILTALAHTTAEWNLITACDMPGLSADFLRELLAAAERHDARALLPANPVSGRLEPLCAVYHRSILPALEAVFAQGIRKVADALHAATTDQPGLVPFVTAEVASFQNVNTPEEWARLDL